MATKLKAGERACPKCKEAIKVDAAICKHCRTEFSAEEVVTAKAEAKKANKYAAIGCLSLVLLLGFCTMAIGGGDEPRDESAPAAAPSEAASAESAEQGSEAQSNEVMEEPASSLTGPQQNAVRSANQYLAMSGFSRKGLIDQLSSDAGEGYDVADATAAVDSLDVDWNEQAVRSAQQYLNMSGFSCQGLVEQLSSSAGEGYTTAQAKHGAQQAGAC